MSTIFPANTTPRLAVQARPQIARDWTKTLWPASYKGVPFFVEMDDEQGRRRIVEHEFPMRDTPYNEDLGEGVRHYDLTAYVASDSSDVDAASVIAICATRGPGALVLPSQGPVIVRCLDFKRARQKDKAGYEALDLKFTRQGASIALASVAGLANLVFVTAEQTSLAAALAFAQATVTSGQPGYVVDAASQGVEDNAAALEAIRATAPVASDVSAAQRAAIQAIYDAAPTIADPAPAAGAADFATAAGMAANSYAADLAARVTAAARVLGKAMPPSDAMAQFEQAFQSAQVAIPAPIYATSGTVQEAANQAAANQALRMASLITYCEAVARMTFGDRPSAITVRANVAEYFESELLVLNAGDVDLAHAIIKLRDSVIDYLSRTIITLAPVITVEANLILPSLFWAWRLYQDPTRSTELADRNQVAHPSFMPSEFEALAS